ncbi:hypothetical protein L1987_73986 [Smallanthus sonchifolius]|uniref:Uncharacterized protein n=1 Tax=Smallanthus sonchifolius TaxID=185202 RepID=A0ACB9A1C7_9ASTR|nr:hypothetical protein L1987_73986 [Smallanthus sonchifolius]
MASDKTQGWSGDSSDQYMEYRQLINFDLSYAAFQAIAHTYHLILAYLFILSSSSASTRFDDWVLNWGKDELIKMDSASVVMSFMAFLGFAIISIIFAYNLCD